MNPIALALSVHVVAAVFLVGGLAFVMLILRSSAEELDPPVRLTLWRDSLARFLPRSWISLVLLLVSGHALVHVSYRNIGGAPPFVRLMAGLALGLAVTLVYLQFFPWRRFRAAVGSSGWPVAEKSAAELRIALLLLLVLGVLTILVASGGRYFL